MKVVSFIVMALLAAVLPARACDYCLCSQGYSPAMSSSWGARIDVRYLDLGTALLDGHTRENPGAYAERYLTTQFSAIIPLWNESASLFASIPLTRRSTVGSIPVMDGEAVPPVHNTGVGDAIVMFRLRPWMHMSEDWVATLGVVGGMKIPTGSTAATYPDGEYLDAHLQTGTGSWDPLIGANVFVSFNDWGASVNLLAAFPTVGARGYRFGTTANYDATVSYNIVYSTATRPGVFLTLGVVGETTGKELTDGEPDANTGGTTLWTVPGVRVDIGNAIVDAGLHLPVMRALTGTQMGGTVRATVGAQWHFE